MSKNITISGDEFQKYIMKDSFVHSLDILPCHQRIYICGYCHMEIQTNGMRCPLCSAPLDCAVMLVGVDFSKEEDVVVYLDMSKRATVTEWKEESQNPKQIFQAKYLVTQLLKRIFK